MLTTHYGFSDWIDYARGLGSATARETLSGHARECGRCAATLGSVETVGRLLISDEDVEPPPDVLRMARAVFSQFQPEHVVRLPRLLVRLVHDVDAQPLAAGVRGHVRSMRRVRFQAADVLVDLRLEKRPGQQSVTLVGQVLEPETFGLPVPRRPVVITSGRRIVAATSTNQHGELLMDYTPAGRTSLHIPVKGCTGRIEISLNELLARPRTRAASVRTHTAGRDAAEPGLKTT